MIQIRPEYLDVTLREMTEFRNIRSKVRLVLSSVILVSTDLEHGFVELNSGTILRLDRHSTQDVADCIENWVY